MIECSSQNCQTRINGSALGKNKDGSTRRNRFCGRCVRLAKEARICTTKGCTTIKSKYDKSATRCAACVRLERGKVIKPPPPKNPRVKGVFVRDCRNNKTEYIKVGIVARNGDIHLFKRYEQGGLL